MASDNSGAASITICASRLTSEVDGEAAVHPAATRLPKAKHFGSRRRATDGFGASGSLCVRGGTAIRELAALANGVPRANEDKRGAGRERSDACYANALRLTGGPVALLRFGALRDPKGAG